MSDRKYGHRGYQDSDKPSGPRGPRTPFEPRPERVEGAPRGRTAGGFGPEVFKCVNCGTVHHSLAELTSESVCAKCGGDLHTCRNCSHFDTGARWECRAEIPARVSSKDRRNECELFAAKIVRDLAADKPRGPSTPDDARKAFDALFKK